MAANEKCPLCGGVLAAPKSFAVTRDQRIKQLADETAKSELRASKARLVAELASREEARLKALHRPSPAEQEQLREQWLRQRYAS